MDNKVKGLTIGIIALAIVLGSVVFLLREPLVSEITQTVLPWGSCLEKYDIIRDVGIYTNNAGRMNEYQLEVFFEFAKQHCNYYVYRWMPEHYPERNNVGVLYHEYRTDLTKEQKQNLIDIGAWPDEFGQFSVKEKQSVSEEQVESKPEPVDITSEFGALGDKHEHASILVRIFGDRFDFSSSAYQIKSSWIHFEGQDGNTVHRHASGVTLGYLFSTFGLQVSDECFVFGDGREFCNNDDYAIKFYTNHQQMSDIRDYVIEEGDRILITYGSESAEEIDNYLEELDRQVIIN